MQISSYWPSSESWRRYWPSGIITLIAVIQLFVSFAVLGLHIGIVFIGTVALCIGAAPWYIMGFVCWAFFLACWISIFCVTCCHRSSVGCATYTMIKNILAFIFSAVLIDFDRKFITGEEIGYLFAYATGTSCALSTSGTPNVDIPNLLSISSSLAKGQLAGSVIILVSSLVFIGIYIYVYIRALLDDRNTSNNTFPISGSHAHPPHPRLAQEAQKPTGYRAEDGEFNQNAMRSGNGSRALICPRCGAIVEQSDRF